MAHILIAHGTSERHTERVAQHLRVVADQHGHKVVLLRVDERAPTLSLDAFDAAMVGGTVRFGRFQRALRLFAMEQRAFLEAVPSAFFGICLPPGAADDVGQAAAQRHVERFVEETGWQPPHVGLFAGRLAYRQVGWIERLLLERLARRHGASTDTSRDHVYTDWDAATRFVEEFLEGHLARRPSVPRRRGGA
ncbi:MAG: flavodoxin domain-containing protein [Myxococcota bacterium]